MGRYAQRRRAGGGPAAAAAAPLVLTVSATAGTNFDVEFDSAVTLVGTPAPGEFQIDNEDPVGSNQLGPTTIELTYPFANGPGLPWANNSGVWVSPATPDGQTGTTA